MSESDAVLRIRELGGAPAARRRPLEHPQQRSHALPVGGAAVAGRIEVAGDRDWFRFALQDGTTYVVSTSALAGGMDTVLDVYAPSGSRIGGDDDGAGGGASRFSPSRPSRAVPSTRA